MTIPRILLAVPAALLLAACGGSDSPSGPNENPGNAGTFSGTVSGGLSKSVTGQAVFGTSAAEGGFALVLGNENDGFIFGRDLAGIPAAGAYPVWNFDDESGEDMPTNAIGGVFGLTVGGKDYVCSSTGGTLTISNSSSTRLQGTLNVTAACYTVGTETPVAITVAGQFSGVGGQVD